jgi:hypothetical protein
MNSLPSCNLLDKARRHHRRAMLKDPSLPALVAGGGKVVSNGHLSAALPLVDGTVAVYGATPSIEWQSARRPPTVRRASASSSGMRSRTPIASRAMSTRRSKSSPPSTVARPRSKPLPPPSPLSKAASQWSRLATERDHCTPKHHQNTNEPGRVK